MGNARRYRLSNTVRLTFCGRQRAVALPHRLSTQRSASRRCVETGRHAAFNRKKRGVSRPDSFTFLGFTSQSGCDVLPQYYSDGTKLVSSAQDTK